MTVGTILLIVLILFLIGALPTWGHSRSWGYGPSGGLGLVVVIVVVLLLMGRISGCTMRESATAALSCSWTALTCKFSNRRTLGAPKATPSGW